MKLEGWETSEDIDAMYVSGEITKAQWKKEIKRRS